MVSSIERFHCIIQSVLYRDVLLHIKSICTYTHVHKCTPAQVFTWSCVSYKTPWQKHSIKFFATYLLNDIRKFCWRTMFVRTYVRIRRLQVDSHAVSAPLRPGSCLLPQVSDLNRFIDYHLRVYVEILPKSRGVTRRVRDELSHPHAQWPRAVSLRLFIYRSDRVPFA